jgi:hypothetical protein
MDNNKQIYEFHGTQKLCWSQNIFLASVVHARKFKSHFSYSITIYSKSIVKNPRQQTHRSIIDWFVIEECGRWKKDAKFHNNNTKIQIPGCSFPLYWQIFSTKRIMKTAKNSRRKKMELMWSNFIKTSF